MYTYCENNPVNYVDYTGENSQALQWLWSLPFIDGSLPIGDIIAVVGILAFLVVGTYTIEQALSASQSDAKEKAEDPPKSLEDSGDAEKDNAQKPSSAGKMQEEVKKGKAPKNVKIVHRAHNAKHGKPHVHFKDGSAMNFDGTPHDAHNGYPVLTTAIKSWLRSHNWATEIRIL